MSDERETYIAGVRIKITKEAMGACARLLDDQDHYPGLKFTGNKDSYKRLRADIDLVTGTLSEIFLEVTKHIARSVNN